MSETENFNDYPKHPGQTTPQPYYVEIPLETFETMSKELDEILEKAMGEIKETVANTAAKAAVDVFAEAKKGGDAGSIARKISEACIECMAVGLKKGFAAALEFMREK